MKDKIINYIKEQLLAHEPDIELEQGDNILESGLIDSMGIVQLIAFIEDEFQLKIPPEDMVIEHFMSVDTIGDYLESRK